MRRFLLLMVCLFFASTLAVAIGCEKKEEAPPAPTERVFPAPLHLTLDAPASLVKEASAVIKVAMGEEEEGEEEPTEEPAEGEQEEPEEEPAEGEQDFMEGC